MWQYWFLIIVCSYLAVSRMNPALSQSASVQKNNWPDIWKIIFSMFVIMIGFRHEVGGDWYQYLEMLESYSDTSGERAAFQDPLFILFNLLAIWSGTGIYLVNFLSAIFFSWGLVVFCRSQPRPWLALVVAVPYLVTVVAMGYTRQGVAIGIAMVGMVALGEGKIVRFMLWITFAALFHKSALVLVPLAVLSNRQHRITTLFWIFVASFTLFVLLLQEAMTFWVGGYLGSEMNSSGAAIRIAMNSVPAVLFLIYRKRFQLTLIQLKFWSWMSRSALLFIVLLHVSPSSTAIDRLALYWIPLQLFVFSRLPDALGQRGRKNAGLVYAVVIYSLVIQFVWLMFADTSFAWLPYQFYPWVWLWQ